MKYVSNLLPWNSITDHDQLHILNGKKQKINTAFLQYFEILNTEIRETNLDVRQIFISSASQFKSANVDLCLIFSVLFGL